MRATDVFLIKRGKVEIVLEELDSSGVQVGRACLHPRHRSPPQPTLRRL